MAKKNKMPKTLFAFQAFDIGDDPIIICAEKVEDISEENAGNIIGVYELRATGKLAVEKSIDSKPKKKLKVGR